MSGRTGGGRSRSSSCHVDAECPLSHPKWLYATIIICSIGAATQGWDQTVHRAARPCLAHPPPGLQRRQPLVRALPRSGAVADPDLEQPDEFGISENPALCGNNCERNQWLVGVVNAGPCASLAG